MSQYVKVRFFYNSRVWGERSNIQLELSETSKEYKYVNNTGSELTVGDFVVVHANDELAMAVVSSIITSIDEKLRCVGSKEVIGVIDSKVLKKTSDAKRKQYLEKQIREGYAKRLAERKLADMAQEFPELAGMLKELESLN